jgi:hypothetical protein
MPLVPGVTMLGSREPRAALRHAVTVAMSHVPAPTSTRRARAAWQAPNIKIERTFLPVVYSLADYALITRWEGI